MKRLAQFLECYRKIRMVRIAILLAINLLLVRGLHTVESHRQGSKNNFTTALRSVVSIYMRNDSGALLSQGSGFFITKHIIVTNYHVIETGVSGFVKLPGGTETFPIMGITAFDKRRDLALIRTGLSGNALRLKAAPNLSPGDEVYAVGSPEGLENSVSSGIISGLRGQTDLQLLQITAPLSHGSSGGPILGRDGEVIGVARGSLEMGQNLNFAVPSQYIFPLLKRSQRLFPLPNLQKMSFEGWAGVRPSSVLETQILEFLQVNVGRDSKPYVDEAKEIANSLCNSRQTAQTLLSSRNCAWGSPDGVLQDRQKDRGIGPPP